LYVVRHVLVAMQNERNVAFGAPRNEPLCLLKPKEGVLVARNVAQECVVASARYGLISEWMVMHKGNSRIEFKITVALSPPCNFFIERRCDPHPLAVGYTSPCQVPLLHRIETKEDAVKIIVDDYGFPTDIHDKLVGLS